MLRAEGHEPVALLCVRHDAGRYTEMSELVRAAPPELDVVMPASRDRIAPLLRPFEPDLALCIGFPWKIPPDALAVPRHGIVNGHPVAAPALPRPEPRVVGDPKRRARDRLHLPLHGRGARHGEHPRPGADRARRRALLGGAHAEARDGGRATSCPASSSVSRVATRGIRRTRARRATSVRSSPSTRGSTGRSPWTRSTRQVRAWRLPHSAAGDRGALTEIDGETVRVLRVSREPRYGPRDGVRRRHTLDRGDGGGMRPVIGITSYAQEASWGVWHLPAALVPLAYVDAIERAGGRAVVIPPAEEDVEETLDALDGIVFSGGADVDPVHYGAEAASRRRTRRRRGATRARWRSSARRSSATCRRSRSAAASSS